LHLAIIVEAKYQEVRGNVEGATGIQDHGIIERDLLRGLHHKQYDEDIRTIYISERSECEEFGRTLPDS
jgi:hypothetical protein